MIHRLQLDRFQTREQAQDAVDLIEIDYEPLPAVSDPEAALSPHAPPPARPSTPGRDA